MKNHDYGGMGAYFVTVCTWHRECLFGEVYDGGVVLNGLGLAVCEEWLRTAELRKAVETDAFVVMPNHIHGILIINAEDGRRHSSENELLLDAPINRSARSWRSPSLALGSIVRGFKAATRIRINEARGSPRAPVWQRNYHEHIIRGDNDLERLRRYIAENPSRWPDDDNHPFRVKRFRYPGGCGRTRDG